MKFSRVLSIFAAMFCLVQAAQARSGLAAYHAHTSAYVTASRYEPRGSLLNVMNPRTGKSILVRVNDRGPFNGNRILDLSTGAFRALYGGLGRGVAPVSYTVISRGSAGTYRTRRSYRTRTYRSKRTYRTKRGRR